MDEETKKVLTAALGSLTGQKRAELCAEIRAIAQRALMQANDQPPKKRRTCGQRLLLLDLPTGVMIHIISMLPSMHDVLRLRCVSKYFCGDHTSCGAQTERSTTSFGPRKARPLIECALEQRQNYLGLPSGMSCVPEAFVVRWARNVHRLEALGFLAPGTYRLFTATQDEGRLTSYRAYGAIRLKEDGMVIGETYEACSSPTRETWKCRIQSGRWSPQNIEFEYRYGQRTYLYTVELLRVYMETRQLRMLFQQLPQRQDEAQQVGEEHRGVPERMQGPQLHPLEQVLQQGVEPGEGDDGDDVEPVVGPGGEVVRGFGLVEDDPPFPVAVLKGRWRIDDETNQSILEYGTVDQMILAGPHLALGRGDDEIPM